MGGEGRGGGGVEGREGEGRGSLCMSAHVKVNVIHDNMTVVCLDCRKMELCLNEVIQYLISRL